MKKLFVLAIMATLLMAGSAFAVQRNFAATPNATFATGSPTTTNNDDSCDIAVAPAATLLLPYFEVSTTAGGANTLMTITNVSRFPQIAHVTVWSEYSVPVLDFNIFLTGYDVQGLSLYDVLVLGQVAGSTGTSSSTTPGSLSATNTSNPNFAATTNCGTLPGQLPTNLTATVLTALTTGSYTGCTTAGSVGGNHAGIARGYVTVDVANNCSTSLPTDAGYFGSEILFDNVLIGDYQQLGITPVGGTATNFDAGGNPLVHIRAIPEGGPATSGLGTNLPYTFYNRYTPTDNRYVDRRQPLPAVWAPRYIENAASGFSTNLKVWREGRGTGTCAGATANNTIPITELVRFDEAENPFTVGGSVICSPCGASATTLPETSVTATTSAVFPQFTAAAAPSRFGGWMYMNLNNGGSTTYSSQRVLNTGAAAPVGVTTAGTRPSQNWVIVQMFGAVGANRMAVDFNAAWLGNGCSNAYPAAVTGGVSSIGPAGMQGSNNGLVCPAGITCNSALTGTNTTP